MQAAAQDVPHGRGRVCARGRRLGEATQGCGVQARLEQVLHPVTDPIHVRIDARDEHLRSIGAQSRRVTQPDEGLPDGLAQLH